MSLGSRFQELFNHFAGSGGALRNVTVMLSGTSAAQLVTFALTIPLARMYSPTDFGFFTLFQSIAGVGVVIAALRYDVAIVLPRSDATARVIQRLASRSILAISALLTAILLLMHSSLSSRLDSEAFSSWLLLVGPAVFFIAQIANRQVWLTRQARFHVIASTRLAGALATGVMQLLFWLMMPGFEGLLAGFVSGQALTYLLVRLRTRDLDGPLPAGSPTMVAVAKRYKKLPLLNGPNALLDSFRTAGISVLIANMAIGGLGQYSLAQRTTTAPTTLIVSAIQQVFLKKMSVTEPGDMGPLVRKLLRSLAMVAVPTFLIFYVLAPWGFRVLFGAEWAEAGQFAQALVPWLFMTTFTAPLANLFIVAERQGLLLAFALLLTAAPLLFLSNSSLGLLETIQVLSLIMSGCLALLVVLSLVVARSYDKRDS